MKSDTMTDPYLHQPREVSIETLALCNARCEFCPYDTLDRKGVKMSGELLWSLLDQMREWQEPFCISPFKVNEPFLDRRLLPLCRDIIDTIPQAKIRLFTNGSRFTPDNVNEVLDLDPSRVVHIWISLNEVDPDRYKETMKYVAFEHVAEKIDTLHKAFARRVRHRVIVSRVSLPREHIEREFAQRAFFECYVAQRWPCFVPFHIKRDGWIDYTQSTHNEIPKSPCARWWELNIMATGVAALCCMDGTGEYSVGDAKTMTLLDIYNQPYLVNRRLGMTYTGGTTRQHANPCNRCTY